MMKRNAFFCNGVGCGNLVTSVIRHIAMGMAILMHHEKKSIDWELNHWWWKMNDHDMEVFTHQLEQEHGTWDENEQIPWRTPFKTLEDSYALLAQSHDKLHQVLASIATVIDLSQKWEVRVTRRQSNTGSGTPVWNGNDVPEMRNPIIGFDLAQHWMGLSINEMWCGWFCIILFSQPKQPSHVFWGNEVAMRNVVILKKGSRVKLMYCQWWSEKSSCSKYNPGCRRRWKDHIPPCDTLCSDLVWCFLGSMYEWNEQC